jgi:lipoate-protein ligase A
MHRKVSPITHTVVDRWQIFPLTVGDQQQHIDKSEDLFANIQSGERAILYWSIARPAGIVLGFSQKRDILNTDPLSKLTCPVYHRRAGGTAVLVGPSLLSLDVILPAGHPLILPDIVESYRWFGEVWQEALLRLGVSSRTVSPEEAHAQRALRKEAQTRDYELLMNRACYGSLSSYEVVVGKRKVVGFDMIRRRAGSLLQAGVLLSWDTAILAHALGHTEHEQMLLREGLQERAVGLDTLARRTVEAQEVIAAFEEVLSVSEGLRYEKQTSL